jgi:hypothetical protein
MFGNKSQTQFTTQFDDDGNFSRFVRDLGFEICTIALYDFPTMH